MPNFETFYRCLWILIVHSSLITLCFLVLQDMYPDASCLCYLRPLTLAARSCIPSNRSPNAVFAVFFSVRTHSQLFRFTCYAWWPLTPALLLVFVFVHSERKNRTCVLAALNRGPKICEFESWHDKQQPLICSMCTCERTCVCRSVRYVVYPRGPNSSRAHFPVMVFFACHKPLPPFFPSV